MSIAEQDVDKIETLRRKLESDILSYYDNHPELENGLEKCIREWASLDCPMSIESLLATAFSLGLNPEIILSR